MDRLTTVEQEIANSLLTIDGQLQTGGYQYYNNISIVNIEDEGLVATNTYITSGTQTSGFNPYPYVNIYLDPREDVIDLNANVYTNKAYFTLIGKVQNDNETDEAIPQNSKFQINKKMNELLSDIKFNFGSNYQLNDTVERCRILNSERKYTLTNSVYRTGDLIVKVEVEYVQSIFNPNNNICY